MEKSNVCVFAKINPKSEFFESSKNELMGMLEATRNETGCLQFDLHISECGRYIFLYEEWGNKASLENHHLEKHTKSVASKLENWLVAPNEVTIMHKL